MLPRIAVDDERWPISMSQIGAWRDFTQSMKLRWCDGCASGARRGDDRRRDRDDVLRAACRGAGSGRIS